MIPKHSSYFDYLGDVKEDSYYKVYLTPEGHIEQHKILYQIFGDTFDKIACNGLTGKNVKKEVFSEAGKILDTANIGREKEVENMKNKSMEELKRINAMQESLNAATKYLNTCGRFYLHRVKNNLIDKLE